MKPSTMLLLLALSATTAHAGSAGGTALQRWLRRQFAENRPFDQIAYELVTAQGDPTAEGPRPLPLLFQKVPEGKVVKNRVHLDFASEDMVIEVDRLRGLGASVIAERSLGDFRWTVMADPEGNEFCVS